MTFYSNNCNMYTLHAHEITLVILHSRIQQRMNDMRRMYSRYGVQGDTRRDDRYNIR